MFTRKKISVIGAGNTGMAICLELAKANFGDVVLLDVLKNKKRIRGLSLDIAESSSLLNFSVNINSTVEYDDISDSDIIIITAGIARKPGMSREDLLKTNARIITDIGVKVKNFAPNAIVIVLSNPVDIMTYVFQKVSRFQTNKVIGQSGILDSARFKYFISQKLNISIESVSAFVLGSHGDEMIPMIEYANVSGIPLKALLSDEEIDALVKRTRNGGGEIVDLLEGSGSAYYAPAASVVEMVRCILLDNKKILPTIAYLDGEYGYSNFYLGVLTILGKDGVQSIVEVPLNDRNAKNFAKSAEKIKNIVNIFQLNDYT